MNRILLDILDWVRRIVWSRDRAVKKRPYNVLSIQTGNWGILKHVTRDTPRSISTYILTPPAPPRTSKEPHYNYHVCLDHLWALDEVGVRRTYEVNNGDARYSRSHSHCITILRAGRFPRKDGNYDSKVLFQGYYDFIGKNYEINGRDRWAHAIFRDFILEFKLRCMTVSNFDDIVEESRLKYLGMGASKIQSVSYDYRIVSDTAD